MAFCYELTLLSLSILDNTGKALAISYQEKTHLLALHKQVTCGKYKPGVGEEPGFLDVVGNDRKCVAIDLFFQLSSA